MSRSPKTHPNISSGRNRSSLINDHDQKYYPRNAQCRPLKLTFAEDYYNPNESADDSFYSCNESQNDPNLSVNDTFYSAPPGTPRSNQNFSRFAQSTPKYQRPQQTPYYNNPPLSPISRTLPSCCRPGQDSFGSSRGADMSSGYFDRSQANSSRGHDMSSGYFDRSQANLSRRADMSANYFDRNQVRSPRGADMNSNYYNRQANTSCGADMNSGYFDRSQPNSYRGPDIMRSANDRSYPNSSRPYDSHTGRSFVHVNLNDTTPFTFLDESQVSGADMSARYFNPCQDRSSLGSSFTHISRNDTTPFEFLNESQILSANASCPGSPFTHINPNYTTPFSFLDESQASSYGGADMSSGFFDGTSNNDFSFMDDANAMLQQNTPIPQRIFKPIYCAANAVSNQNTVGNKNYLSPMSCVQNTSCRYPLPEPTLTPANPVNDAPQINVFPTPCNGNNNACSDTEPNLNEITPKAVQLPPVESSEVISSESTPKSKIPRKLSFLSRSSKSSSPPEKHNSETTLNQEGPKLEDTKLDSINMLSVVISTVMLLAAGVKNIPPNYLSWSVKYLKCIKNMQGQYPANVKKILRMLTSGEDFDKIISNENKCKCPYTPCDKTANKSATD